MKKFYYLLLAALLPFCTACEEDSQNYPDGYDRKYYAFYDYHIDDLGNPTLVNQTLSIPHTTDELTPLNVKFASEITRDFDIEVRLYLRNSPYFLKQLGVAKAPTWQFLTPDSLALPGVDFQLLDSDHRVMTPVRTDTVTYYSLIFPRAEKGVRTLYIESLGNEDFDHLRSAWFSLSIFPIDASTTESLYETSVNHINDQYELYSIGRSYLRRVNFE